MNPSTAITALNRVCPFPTHCTWPSSSLHYLSTTFATSHHFSSLLHALLPSQNFSLSSSLLCATRTRPPKARMTSKSKTADNIERVNTLVHRDQQLTVRMLAYELGMNRKTVRTILTDNLGMQKVCTKMVPKLLSNDHKEHQVNVCRNTLEMIDEEPEFLGKVITGDEIWVFQYSPETKRQSLQWKSPGLPRPKKVRMSKSKIKMMLITFLTKKDWSITSLCQKGKQ